MRTKKTASLFLLILLISLLLCSCSTTKHGMEYYDEVMNETTVYNPSLLPSLDKLTGYTDIDFTEKITSELIFSSYGYALFVTYDKDVYEAEVEKVNRTHSYLDENNAARYFRLPLADINYEGYEIKIVPFYSDDFSCKHFGMIGFNDEEYRICYLMFSDSDLDYLGIDEDPEAGYIDFLDTYFTFVD
ncbi:MAG: hypothetical protein IKN38_10005 [Clostridia bacterium]|nr:hypothetical protein [Clostridia bacterium]